MYRVNTVFCLHHACRVRGYNVGVVLHVGEIKAPSSFEWSIVSGSFPIVGTMHLDGAPGNMNTMSLHDAPGLLRGSQHRRRAIIPA